MAHYASLSRAEIRDTFAAFCAARPVGGKFAHRALRPARGVQPVDEVGQSAGRVHAARGRAALLAAGVRIPGLHAGAAHRVALEAYPGLLARELIGRRSYKSDDLAKQTPERLAARTDLVAGLEAGGDRLGLRLDHHCGSARGTAGRCTRRRHRRGAVPAAGGLGAAARRQLPVRATACRCISIRLKDGSSPPEPCCPTPLRASGGLLAAGRA
jgi:hypothetical protein